MRAVAVIAAVTVTDQTLKWLVTRFIPAGASVSLIPGLLNLTNVRNAGIAFSMLPGIPLAVPAAIALTLLFLLFYNRARWSRRLPAQIALALLGGGALGNLIDRLRVGAVIDYLDLHVWPVFNLADLAVTAGTALLILTLARGER